MNSHTFHTSLYDLLFVGMIFIGFNLALLLWFGKGINRTANRPLALALVVTALWMIRILAIDIRLDTYLPGWDRFPLQFSLALGPLIYFYVLKLTRQGYKFRWNDLLHVIPVLLEQVIPENPARPFLTFISIITYLYYSRRLINQFYRRQKFNAGDRYRYELRWLHKLLTGFGLLWLLWIPFTAAGIFIIIT